MVGDLKGKKSVVDSTEKIKDIHTKGERRPSLVLADIDESGRTSTDQHRHPAPGWDWSVKEEGSRPAKQVADTIKTKTPTAHIYNEISCKAGSHDLSRPSIAPNVWLLTSMLAQILAHLYLKDL